MARLVVGPYVRQLQEGHAAEATLERSGVRVFVLLQLLLLLEDGAANATLHLVVVHLFGSKKYFPQSRHVCSSSKCSRMWPSSCIVLLNVVPHVLHLNPRRSCSCDPSVTTRKCCTILTIWKSRKLGKSSALEARVLSDSW
uniref:Uncharacterized protein n=1 Tax=Anopheles melas TaxID=34690 RepID=A0A182TJX9_9DIPT